MGGLVVVHGDPELLQVVDALGAAGGLAGRLHGGQQEADQDRDDRDHDQQLDQGESPTARLLDDSWRLSRWFWASLDDQTSAPPHPLR